MSLLKSIGKGIDKAERKYHEMKEDSKPIRKKAGQIFDFIIPPPKKGGKATKVKISKCPPCPCSKKKGKR